MTPERETVINGIRIAEYYWAREMVVYVNNSAYTGTYEQACEYARRQVPA